MAAQCLFMINGLGLGNSTRTYAVMEHLVEKGVGLDVITSGNGLTFFDDKPGIRSLTPMEALFYSGTHGRVSGWRTLGALPRLRRLAQRKHRQMEDVLHRFRPDVVVTDSEYTLFPVRHRKIPIIALNNSDVVVSEYLDGRPTPRLIRSQFWIIEFADYLFHRAMCDLVISPAAKPIPPRHGKIRRVGLILRQAVRSRLPAASALPVLRPPSASRRVVFMLSGSIFASHLAFEQADLPAEIDVVGREGPSRGRVHFHGKLMDNTPLLLGADVLVINGGFSAVSEALALGKPTFVIPVPGHAEQYVNARTVADLGRGYVVDEHTVLPRLAEAYRTDRWDGLAPAALETGIDGAREAADAIVHFLHGRGLHVG